MSPTNDSLPFFFQTLSGKKITFSDEEKGFIQGLEPLTGGEWKGEIKGTSSVRRTDRDDMVTDIKRKLLEIQGPYCIYCGLHNDHCGSKLQREHIAPKGTKLYPKFMFEALNLCLACYRCNCELKGDLDVASGNKETYENNSFLIIHPYLDNLHEHLEFSVSGGSCLISIIDNSPKGIYTVDLFELDSPAKTLMRSGLLRAFEQKFDTKYDIALEKILNNKYVSK